MGIYTDAEIRFGIILPEDADEEKVEAAIDEEDGLELVTFGEYDWSDLPTWALVTAEPKVRCGEYAVEKFDLRPLTDRFGLLPEHEEVAKQVVASEWGGDWVADASYLLIWSRG